MDPGATCHESMLITRNQIKASLGKTKLGMYNPTRCNLCPSEGGGFTNMGRNHDQDTSSCLGRMSRMHMHPVRITPLVGELPSGLRDNQNVNALTSTPEFQFVQAMLTQTTAVPTQIAQIALVLMSSIACKLIRDRRSGSRLSRV